MHDQSKIERQAMTLFTNHLRLDTMQETLEKAQQKQESVLAQWHASLIYWQHPSNHPLPLSILSNSCDDDDGSNDISSNNNFEQQEEEWNKYKKYFQA